MSKEESIKTFKKKIKARIRYYYSKGWSKDDKIDLALSIIKIDNINLFSLTLDWAKRVDGFLGKDPIFEDIKHFLPRSLWFIYHKDGLKSMEKYFTLNISRLICNEQSNEYAHHMSVEAVYCLIDYDFGSAGVSYYIDIEDVINNEFIQHVY
ncbi:MAG: hypothetical protein QM504_08465 [Pseudomonadota bacterium]